MTEQELLNDISFSLRAALREKGISQAELARRTGIERRLVNYYVRGKRMPSLKNLLNMFFVLDLRVEEEIEMFEIVK